MAIDTFSPIIKQMNIAYRAKAYLLKTQVQKLTDQDDMLSQAIFSFESALGVYTRDKHALVQLGGMYMAIGNLEQAEEYFKKALTIAPKFAKAKSKYIAFLKHRESSAQLV